MQHSITYSFNIAYTLKTNMYIDIKFSAIQYTSKCKEYISFKNETFHSLEFIPIYHVKKKEMFFHKYRKKKQMMTISANIKLFKLFGFGFRLIFVVEKDEREQKHTAHHGECAYIIRECTRYKAFVLRVLQRTHRHLGGAVEICQSYALVVYLELIHSVYIGDLESTFVTAISYRLHGHTHEWIDPYKF